MLLQFMFSESAALVHQGASLRLVLRRAFALASEAHTVREQVRYTDIYGQGCVRLVRLLKAERAAQGRLADYLREEIDQAILEVNAEFGLDLGG
jgi:hypothetical protein